MPNHSGTSVVILRADLINILRPRQNCQNFPDDIFKCIFLNETLFITLKISLKYVHKVRINNIPSLVQIMPWRRPGDKPLSEPLMVSLLTHISVTRPQWVNILNCGDLKLYKHHTYNWMGSPSFLPILFHLSWCLWTIKNNFIAYNICEGHSAKRLGGFLP